MNYFNIQPDQLIITWFYFPTASDKRIRYEKINALFYEEQNLKKQLFKVKGWGMSCSPCWWACDTFRNFHSDSDPYTYYNVVIDCGEMTYKGFSCQNITSFLFAIQPKLRPDCIIKQEFPF
ncbi:unnamed protein product, partial [Mesorhabditis belari]|uniref:Uncharacterized protein n=1 Tax=Mesorhabditis belari TaxID=2138241 RepID=A0AAF3ESQ9_9BILA